MRADTPVGKACSQDEAPVRPNFPLDKSARCVVELQIAVTKMAVNKVRKVQQWLVKK